MTYSPYKSSSQYSAKSPISSINGPKETAAQFNENAQPNIQHSPLRKTRLFSDHAEERKSLSTSSAILYSHCRHTPSMPSTFSHSGSILPFQVLPEALQFYIFAFLDPKHVLQNVSLVNRQCRLLVSNPTYWKVLNQQQRGKNPLDLFIQKVECLVERRSKGKVFRGIHRMTGQPVTVRRIFLDTTNAGVDDGLPPSLLRQITYLSYLNHDNVVRMMGVEIKDHVVQVYFEHCAVNLKEFIKDFHKYIPHMRGEDVSPSRRTPAIPLHIIQEIVRQLCKGLEYCHSHGCMHRNLKPQNILLEIHDSDTFRFTLKISDFTLSRVATVPPIQYTPEDPKERERSGRQARRLWYRAPELLLRKKDYSNQIDMWSVGCLLGEMVLQEPLFYGDHEVQQLLRIFNLLGSTDQIRKQRGEQPSGLNSPPSTSPLVEQNIPQDLYSEGTQAVLMPQWQKVPLCYAACPPNSRQFKKLVYSFIPDREGTLEKLMKLKDTLGYDGLDFLQKCLSFEMDKRMSAKEGLKHEFLKEEHKWGESISGVQEQEIRTGVEQRLKQQHWGDLMLLPDRQYMQKNQKEINGNMRAILIDWLIDVAVHFELHGQTLHYAVSYIDRTLSQITIEKANLQLVGVTCLKIAEVFWERSKEYYRQENSKEYAYITADQYQPEDVVNMEKRILSHLQFRVDSSQVWHSLMLFFCVLNAPPEVIKVAKFLSDLLLLHDSLVGEPRVLLASGVLFITCNTLNKWPSPCELQNLQRIIRKFHTAEENSRIVYRIMNCWKLHRGSPNFSKFDAVVQKYEQKEPRTLKVSNLFPPTIKRAKLREWLFMSEADF